MAVTEQERRAMNQRKMVIQAGIEAKRKSLMNLSADRYNALAQRPRTVQSMPVQSAGSVIADPRTLPGRNIVDANNSAAINLARQNPGVNLTDELNRRAAAQTAADLRQAGFGGLPQDKVAVIQDMSYLNPATEVAAPTEPEPAPAVEPTPFNYGPGLTPARAEELYGPGGMYGTAPLPGGAYEQMGISPTMMGAQGATPIAPAFPSDQTLKSTSSSLTDAVKKIKKRAAIIRGSAALLGGDSRAADRYEAKALASLKDYAGQYALSQLTDQDFKNNQTLLSRLVEFGAPMSVISTVMNMGLVVQPGNVVDLYNHDTGDVWTGRLDSQEFNRKIASGNWHKSEANKDMNSDLMKDRLEVLKISNQERDDLRSSLKKPLDRIHQIEDSYKKVKITSAQAISNAKNELSEEQQEALGAEGIRDIALINSYQRMIDPATVREGDVALQRSATSALERLTIFKDNIKKGAFLSKEQRGEMRRIADDFYKAQINSYFPEIIGARQFLIDKYASTGVTGLNEKTARLDFSQIVPNSTYDKWNKNYESNLAYVEEMLTGASEPEAEESQVSLSVGQFQEIKAEAEALGLSVLQYLKLQELRERSQK